MIARITILIVSFLVGTVLYGQKKVAEEITLKNGDITLPGTLTYNASLNKTPLVIFVPGSGNPDRDGNQLAFNVKANYIKQLADSLANRDIAIFRYDKRQATKSNIPIMLKGMKFNALAEDVKSILKNFENDKRFNNIILIGHSQGSLVSMLSITNAVDKFVSLAGLGTTVENAIVRQITQQNEMLGKTAAEHFATLKRQDTIEAVNPMLMSIFAPQNQAILKDYNRYNPSVLIKSITIPTMIINGDADIQVRVEDAELLHKAKPDAELVIVEQMNHVLKTVTNPEDNQKSYYSPDFPISTKLINVLEKFIKK
ncbi:alpha/beta hydrolase [Spongiivirga sp. MCCC 1A20706]|uniref:alpha/beta hydrolase family protein n=1 Tax=Spongiivirga sp. MCCC 1A20706 TaxID=3160963 RepID=UPI00397785BB